MEASKILTTISDVPEDDGDTRGGRKEASLRHELNRQNLAPLIAYTRYRWAKSCSKQRL